MINQLWLNTFCTLVDVGHFTQTAHQLFMTQSGVSQHIKKLEQQLDTPLLIRSGKSFTLTHGGKELYTSGKKLLLEFQLLEQALKQDEQYSGAVNIQSPGGIGLELYPYLLDIQNKHKALIFNYGFAPNKSIETALIKHQCDIGLMTELPRNEYIKSVKIADETLVLVTPNNGGPTSSEQQIDWTQLSKLGFISHPDATHHAQLLLGNNYAEFEHIEQFKQKGFSNQISLILEPVSRGLGFTVLPISAAKTFHHQDKININALNSSVSESIYLCYSNNINVNQRNNYIQSIIQTFFMTRNRVE